MKGQKISFLSPLTSFWLCVQHLNLFCVRICCKPSWSGGKFGPTYSFHHNVWHYMAFRFLLVQAKPRFRDFNCTFSTKMDFIYCNDALSYLTVCWWVRGGQRYDVEDTGNALLSKFVWGPAEDLAVSHCAVGGQVVLEGHGTLGAGDLKLGVARVEQPPAEQNREDLNLRHLFLQTNR